MRDNLKIGFKSVRFNWKQYASFFAALFLIQCFFGMLTISSDMNSVITEQIITDEYDYDVVFLDLNQYQRVFLENDELRVFASDHIYDIVRVVDRYHEDDDTTTYDVYLDFLGSDVKTVFKRFQNKYVPYLQANLSKNQTLMYNYSEIYKLNSYKISNIVSYVSFAAIMTVVSILLITSIYRIRVNHYKFQYGIYMSFGADYKQLCKTSFWEMMGVSLVTFIPSQLFSTLIIYLIYHADGFAFHYNWLCPLKIFIINIIIVSVSVCFPMWRVSRGVVTRLIVSEDNSNLVTSPRRSFNFFKLQFPKQYEFGSMWRFRKYLAIMIVTAVGFSSVFVSGFYVAEFYSYTRDYARPQFTAQLLSASAYYDGIADDLAAIDGVTMVSCSAQIDAPSWRSHMLIESGAVRPTANLVVPEDDPSFRAVNDVNYILTEKALVDTLMSDRYNYKIKGDPTAILTDENAVIVSNYMGNKKICSYDVGDTIKVGAFKTQKKAIDYNIEGANRLRQELEYYVMDYIELHVCAVVDGMTTLDGTPVYVSKPVYRRLVRNDAAEVNSFELFISPDATMKDAKQIFDNVRDYTSMFDGKLSLVDNHVVSNGIITRSMNYYALIIAISFLVLAISPLIWFFSQTLFIKKREKEFSVLLWLGTIKTEIKSLCTQNGIVLGVTATVSCFGLSWLIIGLIQLAVTRIPPILYGGTESFYYGVHIPVPALLISMVISIACGFFSSILPLGSFFKRFAATENGGGEYEGDE